MLGLMLNPIYTSIICLTAVVVSNTILLLDGCDTLECAKHFKRKELLQLMREAESRTEHISTSNFETGLSSRRHFLAMMGKGAALAGLGIFGAGSDAAVRGLFGRGLIPAAWGKVEQNLLPKPDMLVHSEQPFNGEFAPHLLNDDVTPIARHFVRNNSSIPEHCKSGDLNGWQLTIDGEVHKPLALSMDDLNPFPAGDYASGVGMCGER